MACPMRAISPDSKVACPDYRPSGSRHVDSSELDQALVQIVRPAVCRSGRLRQSDRPVGHWRCESEWPLGRKGTCLAPPGWFRKIDLGRGSTTREVGFGSWLRANADGSLSIPRYTDHVHCPPVRGPTSNQRPMRLAGAETNQDEQHAASMVLRRRE